VIPDARGLTTAQMQAITREFNYSESTFVLPPEAGGTRKVRIFTPAQEIPFAGHPNVGTAFVLATIGELGEIGSSLAVTFEEKAGLVPITIRAENGTVLSCELKAPQPVSFGKVVPKRLVAAAVSLSEDDVVTTTHEPQIVSVGLPFIMAELRDRAALERPRIDTNGFIALRDFLGEPVRASLYLYARTADEVDVRVRMFAPLVGVPEDPATGSAGCALSGLLTHHARSESGEFVYRIAQGVEMGRPSLLVGRAEKVRGAVTSTWIGGASALVSEGFIEVDGA
jgi:trans-2,3-dihydro-3-hydroxyanthranilate isomerase